jgi:hypothetical protein
MGERIDFFRLDDMAGAGDKDGTGPLTAAA